MIKTFEIDHQDQRPWGLQVPHFIKQIRTVSFCPKSHSLGTIEAVKLLNEE